MNRWLSTLRGATSAVNSVRDLFVADLKELYAMTDEVVEFLPGMVRLTVTPELQSASDRYLKLTWNHKSRLDEIFRMAGLPPQKSACAAVRSAISDGVRTVHSAGSSEVRDAAIDAILQRISHIKIASYESALAIAQAHAWEGASAIFRRMIEEELRAQQEFSRAGGITLSRHAA